MKNKYYYLVEKDGAFKRLVSPSSKELELLESNGWTLHGYDNAEDMPVNPILDDGAIREKTQAEIADERIAQKLARTVFPAPDILAAAKKLDGDDETKPLQTKLLTLLSSNAEFMVYWGAYSSCVDLEHPVCVAALSSFTAEDINSLKMEI